jgi:serine protease
MRPFVRLNGPVAPAVLVVAVVAGWLATTAAQQPERTGGVKQLLSDINAPGIDRGLRDADSPRPAPTRSSRWMTGASGTAYLRDSLIVRFRPGTLPTAQRALLAQVDAMPGPTLTYADFDVVALADGADPVEAAARLSAQPDVEYAQPRYRARALFVPNDPLYSRQWNFPQIDLERAWDINRGGSSNVTVAVVDSGIAYRSATIRYTGMAWRRDDGVNFPALGQVDIPFAAAPDLGTDRFVSPHDFIWDDNLPLDLAGHGTHVAGTIGQLTNNSSGVAGMAFNVKLMPVKVADNEWDFIFNSPFVGTDDTVARGIRYAADNGAKVINLSLGRDSREGGGPAPVVRSAIEYAVSHGAFVAVAGGNEGLDGNPAERYAEFAAQIDGMVAVGATGPDRRRAVYSNIGSHIELVAPGGDFSRGGATSGILQKSIDLDLTETFAGPVSRYTAPRFDAFAYFYFEGSSMATAHVSGLAALLVSQGLTDPAAIEAILKQSATDLGTPGRDNEYGYGLINARAALRGMGVAR